MTVWTWLIVFELTRPHADTHATHGDDISNAQTSATLRAHQAPLGTHAAPLAAVWPRISFLGLGVALIHIARVLLCYDIGVALFHIILRHGYGPRLESVGKREGDGQ